LQYGIISQYATGVILFLYLERAFMEKGLNKFSFFLNKDLTYSYDALTGTLNRQTMVAYIEYLLKEKTPFSLWLFDIDNFKAVNDSFGHMVGDKVLKSLSKYIVETVDGRGVVGRYGGDEFLMVMEGVTDYDDVWTIGHTINLNIGSIKTDDISSLFITVTMGVSRCPRDASTFEELFTLADKALYRGKMKGRNCFIIYLPEKHNNIDISKAHKSKYTSMYLCSRVFTCLDGPYSLEEAIVTLIKQSTSYFMLDHICIETQNGMYFEVINKLAKYKQFKHIELEKIEKLVNNIGLCTINKVDTLKSEVVGDIASDFKAQNLSAVLYCKIASHGKTFGYLRVDMTDTARIWQRDEMDIIVVTANAIALNLYYQNKTIEDLQNTPISIVGNDDENNNK
jgi:diguanylate cyclase (GGDEF)-like protein